MHGYSVHNGAIKGDDKHLLFCQQLFTHNTIL